MQIDAIVCSVTMQSLCKINMTPEKVEAIAIQFIRFLITSNMSVAVARLSDESVFSR